MFPEKDIFQRTELLTGSDLMQKIAAARVILFGTGGVGSWCAESLVRSGIGHLTMVDFDSVCVSNINRQLPATTQTVGKVKVDVLKERLLAINPYAEIIALPQVYSAETADLFDFEKYDYIIDAIDSLDCKAHLIRTATRSRAVFFSSMGAALKLDPQQIRVAEFWKVCGCPLGSALRKKLKQGELPAKKFQCVYSEEKRENKIDNKTENKKQPNGTMAHITAIFGFTLAGLVIQDICK